jgi:TonB family protein
VAAATKTPVTERPPRPAETSQRETTALPPAAAVSASADIVPSRPVRFPRLVEGVNRVTSGDAVALCAGTSVIVSIQVGEDGQPTKARSLGTSPAECRASAEAAARQFRFEPAQDVQGQPVAATVTISISFGEAQ